MRSNLLGIMAAQTQRLSEAAELFGRAAGLRRDDPTIHNNYGNALRDLGRRRKRSAVIIGLSSSSRTMRKRTTTAAWSCRTCAACPTR